MEPALSVVIVSYNTVDLIDFCLRSVLAERHVPMEVFVVDNASTDGSAQILRKTFSMVDLVENARNLGFGAANNQVLSRCRGRYVLFLNPDTVACPGALSHMVRYMDGHPRAGLAGPKLLNSDETLQDSISVRYPGEQYSSGELQGLPGSIACVMGACMIVRADLMRRIGGFDEDFFLYGEDQDLCLRIRKEGYEIGYVPAAEILHHGGKSERGSAPRTVWEKKFTAEYIFYRKHYHPRTIRRIMRVHLLRTKWRLALLSLSLLVPVKREAVTRKMQKYLALQDVIGIQKKRYQ